MQFTPCILFLSAYASVLQMALAQSDTDNDEMKEYCDHDGFHPVCGEDAVILIKHARYGRMHIGRCIPGSSDTIGCSTDVRGLLDRRCSGRRSCEIRYLASIAQEYNWPCGTDLREYLEVAYVCVKVGFGRNEDCGRSGAIEIQSSDGFLSSWVTQETGCGSRNTPWWITVEPGQKIQVHLFDFAASGSKTNTRPGSNVCQVYAIVKEPSAKREESVCASTTRESVVYTSVKDRVEVRLITGTKGEDLETHFLLEFTAIGCSDLQPPAHGWIKRGENEVDIGCDDTSEQTWRLHCEDTQWVGDWHNCTAVTTAETSGEQLWVFHDKYQVMSIMVLIGIVICVCLCLLLVAVIYVKRNWGKEHIPKPRSDDAQDQGTMKHYRASLLNDDPTEYYCYKEDGYPSPGSNVGTNRLTYPPPPYFNNTARSGSDCTCQRHARKPTDGYERPIFIGNDTERRARGGNPKYYELDPDYNETSNIESV